MDFEALMNENLNPFDLAPPLKSTNCCPWRRDPNSGYNQGIISLHQEIVEFYHYILPTATEHAARVELVTHIESLAKQLWPQAIVLPVGSFRTGLYLPTSNVDIVIHGLWEYAPLQTFAHELLKVNMIQDDTLNYINHLNAIDFIDKDTEIPVRISFNKRKNYKLDAAEYIKRYKQQYTQLAPLVVLVKQFLYQRQLNDGLNGGIGAYPLTLMCISFLQLHPRSVSLHKEATTNLGVLLLEFFELYGRNFNYEEIGISLENGGSYLPKQELLLTEKHARTNTTLSLYIIDPVLRKNIGDGVTNLNKVKMSFDYGYAKLLQHINAEECADFLYGRCFLGLIIQINGEDLEAREMLQEKYAHLVVVDEKAAKDDIVHLHTNALQQTTSRMETV